MIAREIRFTAPMPPRGQLTLFAQSLDDIVPEDAPVRALAALLDGVDWSPFEVRYDGIGQPPIHPKYMAGAILNGLMHGFLSSRELESMSRKHVDFLWLMEGFTPDHSTFCKFRDRHEAAIAAQIKRIPIAAPRRRRTTPDLIWT